MQVDLFNKLIKPICKRNLGVWEPGNNRKSPVKVSKVNSKSQKVDTFIHGIWRIGNLSIKNRDPIENNIFLDKIVRFQ